MKIRYLAFLISLNLILSFQLLSQSLPEKVDSVKYIKELLQDAKISSKDKDIEIIIQNVDISHFPEISLIVEAFNIYGLPLDTLYPEKLTVLENNKEKKIISVKKISITQRIPVDFVFIIDKTGSMQHYINEIMRNITNFTNTLLSRGIDYRIGLVLFSDSVEKKYELTDNVFTFLGWLSGVQAFGGKDEKENALEAIKSASQLDFRKSANIVFVLITDAPYHQAGEKGDGQTNLTTEKIIALLEEKNIRMFCIVPTRLQQYELMARRTRGKTFDIQSQFYSILFSFSNQLTNLYSLTYITLEPAIPDSLNISILNEKKQELVKKTIPIVELGRKLIIENLLYNTNSYSLPDSVAELEVLTSFMKNKPNVKILVEGHTDNIGSNKLNDLLSLNRAESVKAYLIKKGIEPNRIETKGFGKRKPIASNDTEFGRRLNRRTEIIIISK